MLRFVIVSQIRSLAFSGLTMQYTNFSVGSVERCGMHTACLHILT